ncbi:MAG: reverse transcriptase domain-containing protein [Candidatus Thiodiazotropha sp.]
MVPKKEPNSFRLIQDLSFGAPGTAINHFIPFENATVSLETFDDVAELVVSCGKDCLLAKADIEEAFRIIPLSPLEYHRLGFTWKGQFYFDRVLVMGASSSVRIFETFSKSIQWVLKSKLGVAHVSHIIDDFIFVGEAGMSECSDSLGKFFSLCDDIGIPIKHKKTILPTTCAPIHGIELDTHSMEARLPMDKLADLKSLLQLNLRRKKIKFQDLQSLLGHLNFACKVIKPGRCFLRRLYDLTCGSHKPSHFIRLNNAARADLRVWSSFLAQYNGCTIITDSQFISSNSLQLYTDAARSKGFACMYQQFWAWGAFSDKVKQFHINMLELYPITLAVYLFGEYWQNKNILFFCDNLSIVYCLNKQTSKDKLIMRMLRIIVLRSLKYNFCFQAKHINSKSNSICDNISRFKFKEAKALARHLQDLPVDIPSELTPDTILLSPTDY